MSRRAAAAALLVAVIAAPACASGRTTQTATPRPSVESPEVPAGLTGAACEPQQGGDEDAAMFLTDVRVERQTGFDRIVFDFEPRKGQKAQVPRFEIRPATPPLREDGSGEPITVAGEGFLGLSAWATGVDLSSDPYREVYTGPKSIKPQDTAQVRELRQAGDFENVVTWYVGLEKPACFVVTTMRDPVRIVIDVSAVPAPPSAS